MNEIEKRLESVRVKPLSPDLKEKILSAAKAEWKKGKILSVAKTKWNDSEQFSPSFRLSLKIFFTAAASLIAVALIFDSFRQEKVTSDRQCKIEIEELESIGITREMVCISLRTITLNSNKTNNCRELLKSESEL